MVKSAFGEPGVFYLDDVRVEEDSLIKNGSFNAGFAGYEVYAYTASDIEYVVDSLNEDNAADFTISNTGDAAWKIQIRLQQGSLKHNRLLPVRVLSGKQLRDFPLWFLPELIKTGETDLGDDGNSVLADGNYVYNGSFQEGKGRLGFWEVEASDGAEPPPYLPDNGSSHGSALLQPLS